MRSITVTLDTRMQRSIPAVSFFDNEALAVRVIRNGASGEIVMAIGSENARYDLEPTPLAEAQAGASDIIVFSVADLALIEPRRKHPFTIWAGGLVAASGTLTKIHSVWQSLLDYDATWNIQGGVILTAPPPPPAPIVSGNQIAG